MKKSFVKNKRRVVHYQSTWFASAVGLPNLVQIAQTIKTKSVKTRSIRPTCLPAGRSVAQQKKRIVLVPSATYFASFAVKKNQAKRPFFAFRAFREKQKSEASLVPSATSSASFAVKKTKLSVPSVPSVRNKKAKRP